MIRMVKKGVSNRLGKLILLSMPRTGSTMITRQVSTHPKFYFVGAIFSKLGWIGDGPGRQELRAGLSDEWNDLDYRIAHRKELMAKAYGLAPSGGCSGFKHHLSGSPLVIEAVLQDATIGKILLTRKNVLASYASDVIAKSAASGEHLRPRFDVEHFEQYLRIRQGVYDRWTPKILNGAGRTMEIDYTEARTLKGIRQIVEFAGFNPAYMAQPQTRKRNPDDLTERFENAGELRAYLQQSGLEEWRTEKAGRLQGLEQSISGLRSSLLRMSQRAWSSVSRT